VSRRSNRRKRNRRSEHPQPVQPPTQPPPLRPRLIRWGEVFLLLVGLYTFVHTAHPTLLLPAPDDAHPLSRSFTVSNDHVWYTLRRVHPTCGIRLLVAANGDVFDRSAAEYTGDVDDLPPGVPRLFECNPPFQGFDPYSHGTLDIHLSYAVGWFPGLERPYDSTYVATFSRDSNNHVFWTLGEPLNPHPEGARPTEAPPSPQVLPPNSASPRARAASSR